MTLKNSVYSNRLFTLAHQTARITVAYICRCDVLLVVMLSQLLIWRCQRNNAKNVFPAYIKMNDCSLCNSQLFLDCQCLTNGDNHSENDFSLTLSQHATHTDFVRHVHIEWSLFAAL